MPEPYPVELRERVVAAYESGIGSYATVADLYRIGEATVKRWTWQKRRDGDVTPRKKGGGNRSDISIEELEAIVAKLGDANAGEITAEYNRVRRGKAVTARVI
jgi:transposase